jgi:hypothetical protein
MRKTTLLPLSATSLMASRNANSELQYFNQNTKRLNLFCLKFPILFFFCSLCSS